MLANHPSIDIGQSTEYAKEMRKWETTHTKYGPPGRQYRFAEYPKRVYMCAQEPGKGIVVSEAHTVHDEHEERNLRSRGFYPTLKEAGAACASAHTEHGKLAAEREWEIRHNRISERATAEVRAHEADHGARHLPEVPHTPVPVHARKGWPKGKPRAKKAPEVTA